MLKFGVIAEGPCDQIVIENILLGYFQDEAEEPIINPIQPPPATSGTPAPPGGWALVFKSIQRGDVQQALQFNDYVVIHIDTDKQEESGFDVPRREAGRELPVSERVARVIERLAKEIDATFYQANKHLILFAIAVDSIECWLLPLLFGNNKAAKPTGCLKAANTALRKAGKKGLSAGDTKFPQAYDEASRDFAKRKKLMEHRDRNPSLGVFINQLDALRRAPSAGKGDATAEGETPPEG